MTAVMGLAAPAFAQLATGDARPSGARRVIRVFDFEERFTNPLPVPQGWYRAQNDPFGGVERPGYPIYNRATLDYRAPAVSGEGTVRLEASGGSVSLRLAEGVIPIFQEADYAMHLAVRGERIEHARFRLLARFLDESGDAIPGSEVVSEPMRPSADRWDEVRVRLPGEVDGAVSLQLDLELIQPEQLSNREVGPHHVWKQDLEPVVWVDDLAITQMPRVKVVCSGEANVVTAPETPEFSLTVRDLSGEKLTVRYSVQDDRGDVVDEGELPISGGFAPVKWTPALDRYGWYRLHTDVVSDSGVVARSATDFAYLAGLSGGTGDRQVAVNAREHLGDRARFGIFLRDLPDSAFERVGEVVRASSSGTLTLGIGALDEQERDEAAVPKIARALAQLRGSWISLGIAFDGPSNGLAEDIGIDAGYGIGALAQDQTVWHRGVDGLLDRFGQMVTRWMPGVPADVGLLFDPEATQSVLGAIRRLESLVPGPVLQIPWSPSLSIEAAQQAVPSGHQFAVGFDAGTGVQEFESFLNDWSAASATAPMLRIQLMPPTADGLGRRALASEMVKRVGIFWNAFAREGASAEAVIELADPWSFDTLGRDAPMPSVLLAAWRNCINRFEGRQIIADLPIADGVRCFVLAPGEGVDEHRGGALIAWRTASDRPTERVQLFLGDGDVRLVDLFGNQSAPLDPIEIPTADGSPIEVHEIPLGHEPVFVEGIDTALVRFGASVALEPRFMQATGEPTNAVLSMSNPWPTIVEGAIAVVEPGGRSGPGLRRDPNWRISPRVSAFTLQPGEAAEMPISIEFSPVEEDGVRRMVLDVDLASGPHTRRVRVFTTFEIGLEGILLDSRHYLDGDGGLRVDAMVTNTGDRSRVLDVMCNLPGQPRSRASIDELAPGTTVVRRFRFPAASIPDSDRAMRLVITDSETGARLNRTIEIEQDLTGG